MSKLRRYLYCLTALGLCLPIIQLSAQDTIPLPVRKVELYKNGIGYFEHLGMVKGQQTVEIVLPSSQLNDVLKSLTVLDLGQGQIAGVNYGSTAPLDRRLAEIPINLGPADRLVDFLNKIRGTGIEIAAPSGTISGKLMGAELRTKTTGPNATSQVVQVSVFTPAGDVRLVELESVGAFKLSDQTLASELGRYLDLLNTTYQRDVRHLRIQTIGKGERELYVSYTAESPIWKTTYRIILDPKEKPLLQGWAIVDNTTPMDWLDVSLSLVAGAPVSFIQNLSQPLYARRPVVPLPQGYQVRPQVYEATIEDEMLEDREEMRPAEEGVARGGALGLLREKAAREEMPMTIAAARSEPTELSSAMRQQVVETAQAQAVGEQFEYRMRQPVSIRRNESALLPIIQSDVEGEKVSIYRENSNESNPRFAFWLKNTSGLTLDAGSVTVIDTNAFAGEGLIETVQPGESRLLSYAIDLGTTISTVSGSERQRVERVRINQGVMQMTAKMVEKKTYKIRNNSDKSRTVVLEHAVRRGWELIKTVQPAESSANYYRFKVEAKPKTTTEFIVQEESPLESRFSLSSVTPEQIAVWVRERSIDPEIEKSLRAIAVKKSELNDLVQKIAGLEKEQSDIFRDQERLRDNLSRLRNTPEEAALRQRYISQLEDQENRLGTLRVERDKIENSRAALQKQIDEMIQALSFDKLL